MHIKMLIIQIITAILTILLELIYGANGGALTGFVADSLAIKKAVAKLKVHSQACLTLRQVQAIK